MLKNRKNLLMVTCLSGAISLSGCNTVATIVGADSSSLNQQSAVAYQELRKEASAKRQIDTSSRTYQRIYSVFNRMKPVADRANKTGVPFSWELTVLRSDTINAFVMPGGKVVFYTGIVEKLNLTDNEIAAVMGHEMTHALEEHAKSKIGAQALTGLAIGVGASAAGLGETGTQFAQLGSQLGIGLPYSRTLESRADKGGLILMAEAGYDPNAAITLWEKMQKNDGKQGPAFLSTHPSNSHRISEMRKNLPQALQIYNARTTSYVSNNSYKPSTYTSNNSYKPTYTSKTSSQRAKNKAKYTKK